MNPAVENRPSRSLTAMGLHSLVQVTDEEHHELTRTMIGSLGATTELRSRVVIWPSTTSRSTAAEGYRRFAADDWAMAERDIGAALDGLDDEPTP